MPIDVSAREPASDCDTEVKLFFTRTIRRKMVLSLALVLIMLAALSLSGMSGLKNYRDLVDDLQARLNEAPRRADLAKAVGQLSPPLSPRIEASSEAAAHRLREFRQRLAAAKQEILEFRRRLVDMPTTPETVSQRLAIDPFLVSAGSKLDTLERLSESPSDSQRHWLTTQLMLAEVIDLQELVRKVPDPEVGLSATLVQARKVYRSRFWMVSASSAVVVVVFLGLAWCGYSWIFLPIRKLHEGARRVAQGDFHYRVELKSHDEMAELADAFNKMTARFREITEDLDRQVRQRSNQLVRSERLAGVGFLSAGVAHEINNPLSAIVMASDSLRERTAALLTDCDNEDGPVIRQYLEMIAREAQRCREITAKLLDFSRGQDAARGRNDLASLVAEVLSMVRHMSKFRDRHIEFARPEPCHLEVNGPEIKQVVLNLVANALESMDAGGTLRIDITKQTDHVLLVFRDDGCGMTAEVIENLFEPFFTQRRTGKGTGLGLSISHRIISDHGGTIEATSDGPGQGSTFRVHLPRNAASSEAAA